MPGDVLWIEGVGPIGQYYNYWDALWEKGIPYFVRDVYLSQLNDIEFKINIPYRWAPHAPILEMLVQK